MDATFRPETVARFWAKVNKGGPVHPQLGTACWEWTAYVLPNGYGQFCFGKLRLYAHRVGFVLAGGFIPDGFKG
jgi:hypothetical protein